jgi:hypothetical protein
MSESKFADDVARALHRRMRRRRLVFAGGAAALVALVLYFVTCGHGFGLGGRGAGSGVAPASDAGPRRCMVRVTATGYVVDGKPLPNRDAVVTACRVTTGAEVTITGDARQGDWDDLRAALEAAHVTIYLHAP